MFGFIRSNLNPNPNVDEECIMKFKVLVLKTEKIKFGDLDRIFSTTKPTFSIVGVIKL